MHTSQTSNRQSLPLVSWPALIQLILSALAAFLLLGAAALLVLTSAIQYFSQGSDSSDLTQPFMVAASLAFGGVLILPSAWYTWKHLAFPGSEPAPRQERRGFLLLFTLLVLVLVVGALLLGNWASQNNGFAWFLLPPLNIIATGLPTLWIIYIGTRGLISGSPRRHWGVFATGLVLGPLIILTLELLAILGIGILAILWAALDSNIASQLNSLVFRLQSVVPNQDAILHILLPYLLHPGVLFIGFSFISVIFPIIEESLKPIGVWFLAGQKLTPAQGFAYGVLSGAGFGLFENLGNTSGSGELWAILASARISTLLLHSLTTGLVGWALASAWGQKRYLRLALTYAFAVAVHGLWNAMAVISTVASLEQLTNTPLPTNLLQIGELASIGIIALGVFILMLYISFNARLRNGLRDNPSRNDGVSVLQTSEISSPQERELIAPAGGTTPLPEPPDDTPNLPPIEQQSNRTDDNPPPHPESNP